MSNPAFIDGLFAKKPHEKAPDFVKAKLSIKREDMLKWLGEQSDEWINIDVKESGKTGKWYAAIDEWKPNNDGNWEGREQAQQAVSEPVPAVDVEDIPFR